MEQLIQKLTSIFRRQFPGSETELEPRGENRVSGFLVWNGFEGHEHIERQREVWKIIRAELSREEQHQIAAVLTLTPEEMAAARES